MLRGIDVKQVFLQTNSVERVQQTQQQHPDMQQRYLEIQLGEEKKLQKENVHNSEEAEKARIGQKKEEEKRKGAQKGEHNKNPDESGEKPGLQSQEEHEGRSGVIHIDIKV